MFGMFKKKPIESKRLEVLFIAHVSERLRENPNTNKDELQSSFIKALKWNSFTTSPEQDFAVTMACVNIASSSELKKAISSYRLQDDRTLEKLEAIRMLLAAHQVFLLNS